MVLMRANPLQGPLEGVGLVNRDFLGPWNGMSEVNAIWAQHILDFQGSPLPMAFVMDLPPSRGGGWIGKECVYFVPLLEINSDM